MIPRFSVRGQRAVTFDFSCTDPGGKVISGHALINKPAYASLTGTKYRVMTFLIEDTGVTSTVHDSAVPIPTLPPNAE